MLAAGVIAVVAAAVVIGGLATRHTQAEQLRQEAGDRIVPTVNLVSFKDAAGAPLELPARMEAWSRAPIYARVSGYLQKWTVDIGAPVKAGQLLAQIDTPDLDQDLLQAQAQLATARTGLALAENTAKRWQQLVSSQAVSRQEADEKQNDFQSRKSNVQALQATVDRDLVMKRYTRLVAPFDGVVTARNTDVGALVTAGGAAGNELFVVSDTHRLRVYVRVPQLQVALIQRGSRAELTVPERRDRSYKATVESLSQAIDAGSGAMLVQLSVDNKAGELLPGGFATVRFAVPAPKNAVMVPPGALIVGKNGTQVATVDANNRVHVRKVAVGRDFGNAIELATGVTREDRIIDSPPDGIADGDLVRLAQAGRKGA
jgi:RND family efflux transporter MFP subunit